VVNDTQEVTVRVGLKNLAEFNKIGLNPQAKSFYELYCAHESFRQLVYNGNARDTSHHTNGKSAINERVVALNDERNTMCSVRFDCSVDEIGLLSATLNVGIS